jgi:HEAT repeat protein
MAVGPDCDIDKLKDEGNVQGIIDLLNSNKCVGEAIKALGEKGDSRAIIPLIKSLEKQTDESLKVETIKALGRCLIKAERTAPTYEILAGAINQIKPSR